MVSRREMLLALLATGTATACRRSVRAPDDSVRAESETVRFAVPAGACDCHVHVFGDPVRFPLSPDRPYTPPPAPAAALREHLRGLHLERVVIVSPAVYGGSNECTLDAIRQLGAGARGVALAAPETPDAELDRLRRGGIRGIRLNFETFGVTDSQVAAARFRLAATRAAARRWHVQINTRLSVVEALEAQVLATPAMVVFDHFAQADAARGVDQPGFAALVRLVRSGRAYVKLSAPYRISTRSPGYADVAPLARALIAANAERVVWGSDWPHPDAAQRPGRPATALRPPLPVDDGLMLNQLGIWAPDPAVRRAILVENPARLYGF